MKAITFYGIVAQVKNEIKPHLVSNNMVRIEDTLMALEKIGLLREKPPNQVHTDEEPCSYCGTYDELERHKLCSECVGALPR